MNTPTDKPGAADNQKPRPYLLITIIVVAVAFAALLLRPGRKPAPDNAQPVSTDTSGPSATVSKPTPVTPLTAPSTGQVISNDVPFKAELETMLNRGLVLSERRKAADALVKNGSEAAMGALKQAFTSGPEELKVAIAQSLGKCTTPECARWLQEMLQDPSVLVARGAVRGLAEQDTMEAAGALVRLLNDANADMDLRNEVASSLAGVNQPGVIDALANIARTAEDQDFATAALTALGSHDFAETQAFFQQFLQTPDIPSDLRVAAVEAIAQAQGDPTAFLLGMTTDKDSEVRSSAAWAMSATEATGSAGPQLLEALGKETDPSVRLREYQALGNQDNVDVAAAMTAVQKEKDPSARIAGLDLLARLLRDQPSGQLQNFFDKTAVTELKNFALGTGSYDDRQAAIIALTRAAFSSRAAGATLEEIRTAAAPK